MDPAAIPNPRAALRRILADRYGELAATEIMAAYDDAARRYARARRVLAAQRWLKANADRDGARYARTRARAEELVANAEDYIAGRWQQERRGG